MLIDGATTNVLDAAHRRRPRKNTVPGEKWCPHCEAVLSIDAFGLDRTRNDGLSGWCRACRAGGERHRRSADIEASRGACRAQYRRDPRIHKAHVALNRAIRAGRITKPRRCPACNRERKIEAHHHRGYDRQHWLDVVWRCRQCHTLEHKRPANVEQPANAA